MYIMTDLKIYFKKLKISKFNDVAFEHQYVMRELKSFMNGDEFYALKTQTYIHNIWRELQKLIASKNGNGNEYYDLTEETKLKVYKIIDRYIL